MATDWKSALRMVTAQLQNTRGGNWDVRLSERRAPPPVTWHHPGRNYSPFSDAAQVGYDAGWPNVRGGFPRAEKRGTLHRLEHDLTLQRIGLSQRVVLLQLVGGGSFR